MILSPIDTRDLPDLIDRFRRSLSPSRLAQAAVVRIAASLAARDIEDDWHRQAVALTREFGMNPIAEAPQDSFSWDGAHVCTLSEPSVLIHEVAHYQTATPARRFVPDFGLGAGPETGRAAEADRHRRADDATLEAEERMASLLGILWEVELGQAGIGAFQEQNWLEGSGRASTAEFFERVLERLHDLGLIDDEGRPRLAVRIVGD